MRHNCVSFKHGVYTSLFDGLGDHHHDMVVSLLEFVLGNVEFEIEHPDEVIGHLSHLILRAGHRGTKEEGLGLVSIEEELSSKCHGSMKDPLGVLLSDNGAAFFAN